MMKFKVGAATDIGRKRSQNQDSIGSFPDLGLFLVSDGMGGHQGGETASSTAVEVIHQSVKRSKEVPVSAAGRTPLQTIETALQNANHAIYERSIAEPKLRGMGTTTVALLFENGTLTIGHVGDSRCYYLRPHAIWQATRDHSLVEEKLRAGLITREAMKTDRMKNVITRSVGFEPVVQVDLYQMNVKSGDCFLVCSDGLSGLVSNSDILSVVQKDLFEGGDAQKAVTDLIAMANANGGDDNVSTIVVQVI
jgi:protein phosphatase